MSENIFTTSDPLNRSITLKSETWNSKILNLANGNDNGEHGNSHPDMQFFLGEVQRTIESPNYIIKDLEVIGTNEFDEEIVQCSENREEFYRFFINSEKECLNVIKVVVEFNTTNDKGEIVTTYRISRISEIKTKGGVVYDSNQSKL